MARDNGNGTVTVERGDTLSHIALKYLGSANRYQELARINGISNPNRIYVGQVIKISGSAASGGGSASTANTNCVNITHFGELSTNPGTLFAVWTWGKESNTEKYEIEWKYDLGNGIWFIATSSNSVNEENREASRQIPSYSIPSGAKKVQLRIKPIAKKTTNSNGKETTPWTANWCSPKEWTAETAALTKPPVPQPKIEKYKLTCELDGLDALNGTHIVFEIYKEGESTPFKVSGEVAISFTKTASYSCDIEPGFNYQVRCKAVKNGASSEWTEFSDPVSSMPSTPAGFTEIRATSETSVYLAWNEVATADAYDIEYTTKKEYFDYTDQTQNKTDIKYTNYEFVGLEAGQEYFFRVRAVRESIQSSWSEISSIVIGEKPSAPTTWSSSTTVIVGEPLTLYWLHNTIDGSSQKQAELELTINGVKIEPAITIKNTTDKKEKDKTSKCFLDTETGIVSWTVDGVEHNVNLGVNFIEGIKIQWRVRTAGITNEYSDWSVQRTIDLYAPPTLTFSLLGFKTVTDADGNTTVNPGDPISTLMSFPFYAYGLPGPKTQNPIGYHLSVRANESYTTVDQVGNEQIINKNGEVYSKYFDITDSLLVEFTPGNVDLQNGINYTVTCTVTMDSGLTTEASKELYVSWTDERYTPNAEITYDSEKYVTHIRPYCESHKNVWREVIKNNGEYEVTENNIDETSLQDVYTSTYERVLLGVNSSGTLIYYCEVYTDNDGNPIDPKYYKVTESNGVYIKSSSTVSISTLKRATTVTGEEVSLGKLADNTIVFYSIVDEATLVEDVTLSVYRREYDGSFVEIMTGINNTRQTFTTDPHPALDYARYRIVAIVNSTGAVSYYDLPGLPIDETGVIIQWDEKWSTFDADPDSELANPPWTGSMIRIPYNIDVSDNNSPDVTMVNYIGRKRPVSYYGTQIGEKSSWNVVIPKDDKETLYALRRLAIWMGDVYVREPSGSGYWANITVSFNQSHGSTTIPVSFGITRVEGGI